MAGKTESVSVLGRVRTGVEGFDDLINGGIPSGNIVLVSGSAGTGKSIFSFEFIYNGAKDHGEPGVFVTLEEFPERIIAGMKNLGFTDVEELIAEKKMNILKTDVYDIAQLVITIENIIDQYKAKRVVIDSVAPLSTFSEKPFVVRKTLFEISNMLKRQNVTAILTCGTSTISEGHYGVTIEEYAVDGIITLFRKLVGAHFIRALSVTKMRGTAHTDHVHPISIEEGGLIVQRKPYPQELKLQ